MQPQYSAVVFSALILPVRHTDVCSLLQMRQRLTFRKVRSLFANKITVVFVELRGDMQQLSVVPRKSTMPYDAYM